MIIPAVLENSVAEVQRKINLIKGLAKDNLTVSPVDLLNIDFADLTVDIHLMTEESADFLEESAGLRRS